VSFCMKRTLISRGADLHPPSADRTLFHQRRWPFLACSVRRRRRRCAVESRENLTSPSVSSRVCDEDQRDNSLSPSPSRDEPDAVCT
jgi:hypothetical protein